MILNIQLLMAKEIVEKCNTNNHNLSYDDCLKGLLKACIPFLSKLNRDEFISKTPILWK